MIIENLNKKMKLLGVSIEKLDYKKLTEVENNFINTYKPERSLIVYGTLAPNRSNYSEVEHIKGKWMKGIVKGKLENAGWATEFGYPAFRHTRSEEQENIEAYILFSDRLGDNWASLDEFEGNEYIRILAKFELENGEVGVGNIYAASYAAL